MKQKETLIVTIFLGNLLFLSCGNSIPMTRTYKDYECNPYQIVNYKNGSLLNASYISSCGDTIAMPLYDQEPQLLPEDQIMIDNIEHPNIGVCYEGDLYAALFIDENGFVMDRRILKEIPDVVECNQIAMRTLNRITYVKPALLDGKGVKSLKILKIPFRTKRIITD